MIDVDHFKAVNDNYGHQAGDKVLSVLAGRLARCVRPYDRVGRYGGDEILIVLPDCVPEVLAPVAERLRRTCLGAPVRFRGRDLRLTLSLGGATSADTARMTADRLIRAGDRALYQAKHRGRNCAVCAEPAGRASKKGGPHGRRKK